MHTLTLGTVFKAIEAELCAPEALPLRCDRDADLAGGEGDRSWLERAALPLEPLPHLRGVRPHRSVEPALVHRQQFHLRQWLNPCHVERRRLRTAHCSVHWTSFALVGLLCRHKYKECTRR